MENTSKKVNGLNFKQLNELKTLLNLYYLNYSSDSIRKDRILEVEVAVLADLMLY
ncbi:MAG: hypothetical protein MJZ78_07300 [Bacteroidales bacterium]|nr:hypothetical protein [Bacteroidales bacterium]